MDVDDAVGEHINQIDGYLRQEASQDDVVAVTHCLHHKPGLVQQLQTSDDGGGHAPERRHQNGC